jgi:hypothetical protein
MTNEIRFTIDNMFPDTNDLRINVSGMLVKSLIPSDLDYRITSDVVDFKLK